MRARIEHRASGTTPRTIADAPLGGFSVAELQVVDDALAAVDMARSARHNDHEQWVELWFEAGMLITLSPAAAQNPLVSRLNTPPHFGE